MKSILNNNEKLISQLKSGKEEAYIHLVDNYHHKLCIYANSLINDSLSAEDIVQNVFIKLWKRRKKLRVRISIESLLYKSVYNEFIDQYRKKATILSVEQRYLHYLNSIIDEYDNDRIDGAIKMVYKVVQSLPPKCQEVFLLSKKEGLSNMEIAEHLNVSVKTVESQITKAFKVLNKKLGDKIKPILFLLFDFKNDVEKKDFKLGIDFRLL